MLELSWQDWACVFVGAFVSYHVLNWLTTMPPKKFTVPVPEGNDDIYIIVLLRHNTLLAANPRWKGKVLENATIRVR